MERNDRPVGIIGLGLMGAPIAGHCHRAGDDRVPDQPLHLFALRQTAAVESLTAAGAVPHSDPGSLAAACGLVLTIVGGPDDVAELYRGSVGSPGLLAAARPGTILVDMTTSSPRLAAELGREAVDRELGFIDAPVSGGQPGAKNGTLTVMAGGREADLDRARPVLQRFSQRITLFGSWGAGLHAKLANQIAVASSLTSAAESLAYGRAAGVDTDALLETLLTSTGASRMLDVYGQRMLEGDFAPGFTVRHFVKDLGIALEEANALGLDLPGLAAAARTYEALAAGGEGETGIQAVFRFLAARTAGEAT